MGVITEAELKEYFGITNTNRNIINRRKPKNKKKLLYIPYLYGFKEHFKSLLEEIANKDKSKVIKEIQFYQSIRNLHIAVPNTIKELYAFYNKMWKTIYYIKCEVLTNKNLVSDRFIEFNAFTSDYQDYEADEYSVIVFDNINDCIEYCDIYNRDHLNQVFENYIKWFNICHQIYKTLV